MVERVVVDSLWYRIKDLLPERKSPGPKGGRPPVDDRIVLEGIVFMLVAGIPWRYFPNNFGCSRSTCWRRIQQWQELGIWEALYALLLDELQRRGLIRWSRAAVDSSLVRAMEGGEKTGRNPADRGRRGSKHHLLVDAQGIPLAIRTTAANRHDVTQIVPLVNSIPPVRGKRTRPRRLYGDRAYDSQAVRNTLKRKGIRPWPAPQNLVHVL